MSPSSYHWRQLTPEQQQELLHWRQDHHEPWHSPPHRPLFADLQYHITAACFEHQNHIGKRPERLDTFTAAWLALFNDYTKKIFAWCVLPNHYHILIETSDILDLFRELGKFHGRTSYFWNGEEQTRGRKVFYRAMDREIRSERHFWSTWNYIHHNPVHHGYVQHGKDWPWSSAGEVLKQMGSDEVRRIWYNYPIRNYGEGWDDADL